MNGLFLFLFASRLRFEQEEGATSRNGEQTIAVAQQLVRSDSLELDLHGKFVVKISH